MKRFCPHFLAYQTLAMALACPPWILWTTRDSVHAFIWWLGAAIYGLLIYQLLFGIVIGDKPNKDQFQTDVVEPVPPSQTQEPTAEFETENQRIVEVRLPVSTLQHEELKQLMSIGQWDTARGVLQKIAYTMPSASAEEKLMFAYYSAEFAKLDPLFSSVLAVVLPAVKEKPGIKQVDVYDLLPDLDKETIRYVLYYGHMLNLIERRKKGSTYELFTYCEGISKPWADTNDRNATHSEPRQDVTKSRTLLSDKAMVKELATLAQVPTKPIVAQTAAIMAALKSGNNRNVELVLRECCPETPWSWPAADALIDANTHIKTRRNQLIGFLAHMIWRTDHWRSRVPQLLENIDRRPYWQMQSIFGDSKDRADCAQFHGRIERYDDIFWTTHAPWLCDHPFCRCTIKSYRSNNPDDILG